METIRNKFFKNTSFAFIFFISVSLFGQKQEKALDFIISSEDFRKWSLLIQILKQERNM